MKTAHSEQQPQDPFNGGCVVLPDGTEAPITEAMVQHSLDQLMNDSVFPYLYCYIQSLLILRD